MNTITESVCIQSPVGPIEITGSSEGISSIIFLEEAGGVKGPIPACLEDCVNQLNEYFKGERTEFNLKIAPQGTEFQLLVWEKLRLIPFGKTISYLELARMTGSEKNTRAVGNANGKNRINIVVPCHRVIGISGKLTGYGGGLWRKATLLRLELENSYPGLFSNHKL